MSRGGPAGGRAGGWRGVVNDERDVVGLLHRADWTQLTLSARVSDGSTVLIAPGGRYRYDSPEYVTGCDGGRPWELSLDEDDADGRVHWVSGPEAPLPELLCPARLLKDSVLKVQGRVRACGRDALDVAIWHPGLRGRPAGAGTPDESAPVRVWADAELGILLRIAVPGDDGELDDGELEVTELVSADFDPVIDPARFAPPPGSRIAESTGEALGGMLGPAWWAAKTAAGLAAGGLGAWIKYSPFRRAQPAAADGVELESAIPADEPPPDLAPDRVPAGLPLSDDLLDLLQASQPVAFTATLHQWTGVGALASSVPTSARRAGFGGLGFLMDAISDVPATSHTVSRIRVAGPDKYQIDHARQPKRDPVTIASDGQRTWEVYPDKITTGPAQPLPRQIRDLTDPSWLLGCWLSGGTPIPGAVRPACLINAGRRPGDESLAMIFPAAVALFDTDLGLVLRLTSYIGTNAVQRLELRDLTTDTGDFQVELPAGLPVIEEPQPPA
jgi:hypothetical protein